MPELDGLEERARFVQVRVVRPAALRVEPDAHAVAAAAAVRRAVRAGAVPREADEEAAVVPEVRGPERLGVGHEGGEGGPHGGVVHGAGGRGGRPGGGAGADGDAAGREGAGAVDQHRQQQQQRGRAQPLGRICGHENESGLGESALWTGAAASWGRRGGRNGVEHRVPLLHKGDAGGQDVGMTGRLTPQPLPAQVRVWALISRRPRLHGPSDPPTGLGLVRGLGRGPEDRTSYTKPAAVSRLAISVRQLRPDHNERYWVLCRVQLVLTEFWV